MLHDNKRKRPAHMNPKLARWEPDTVKWALKDWHWLIIGPVIGVMVVTAVILTLA